MMKPLVRLSGYMLPVMFIIACSSCRDAPYTAPDEMPVEPEVTGHTSHSHKQKSLVLKKLQQQHEKRERELSSKKLVASVNFYRA